MSDFPDTIPAGEASDSSFGEYHKVAVDRGLLTFNPHDMTDREIQIAILLELRAARQEKKESATVSIRKDWW